MTSIKKVNRNHIGVIMCSLIAIVWVYGVEDFGAYILLLFFFLPIYSFLNRIKFKPVKVFLIIGELLWLLFIGFFVFWLENYKAGEYLYPLSLFIINVLFRVLSFLDLYSFKHKTLIGIILSFLIPILIYWYGTTDHLSIGF